MTSHEIIESVRWTDIVVARSQADTIAAEIESLRSRLEAAERERQDARNAVSFFASVIKSGEPWSAACELSMRSVFHSPTPTQGGTNGR
jgi:hypothetical protein